MIRNLGRFLILRLKLSSPEFRLYFSLLGYLLFISLGLSIVRGGSGERMTNAVIPGLYVPPRSPARSQREREKSREKPLRGGGPRDQQSPRVLVASSAPKISEISEPLAFLKGSRISEILEPLGSPQEAF